MVLRGCTPRFNPGIHNSVCSIAKLFNTRTKVNEHVSESHSFDTLQGKLSFVINQVIDTLPRLKSGKNTDKTGAMHL
jgi:hypothetical protein